MTQGLGSTAGGSPEPTGVFIPCLKYLCCLLDFQDIWRNNSIRRSPPLVVYVGGSFLNVVLEEGNRRAVIIPLCLISLMQMSWEAGKKVVLTFEEMDLSGFHVE